MILKNLSSRVVFVARASLLNALLITTSIMTAMSRNAPIAMIAFIEPDEERLSVSIIFFIKYYKSRIKQSARKQNLSRLIIRLRLRVSLIAENIVTYHK